MTDEYLYKYRAVAFLDVLGFKQKLIEFEEEAKSNPVLNAAGEVETDSNGKYISRKANEFINTFKNALGQLDVNKYRYYLFSDSICITSINDTNAADLEDLLLVIAKLYFEFAQRGYFLRGGIDYGLFIDEETLAVGNPLAVAYDLETNKAVYPRIVLSQNLVDEFQQFDNGGIKQYAHFYSDALIIESCEIKFLNIFLQVFQSDYRTQREDFFRMFSEAIKENLQLTVNNEAVHNKYKWLAEQFNEFIELFTKSLAFLDSNFDPETESGFIQFVVQQKINYAK